MNLPSNDIRLKWLKERGISVYKDQEQLEYVSALFEEKKRIHWVQGNAGCGKTTLALLVGAYLVEKGEYDKIIYIRNHVATREVGFLPGDLQTKENVLMEAAQNTLDLVQPGLFERWSQLNPAKIEARSTSYLRGITFSNAWVVIDEIQSFTLHEIQTTISRVSDSCKVVAAGSLKQIDDPKLIRYNGLTPFEVFMKHYQKLDFCTYHTLHTNYRGKISLHADLVDETIQEIKEANP